MIRRLRQLVVAVALAALVSAAAPGHEAEAQLGDLIGAAAAVSSLGGAGTAVAAAQSAYALAQSAESLGKTIFGTGDVKVEFKIDRTDMMIDLGLAYQIQFEMTLSYGSAWAPGDYVFAELYVLADENVVYYKRIPEEGYFAETIEKKIKG